MAVACAVDGAVVEPPSTVQQFLVDLPRCAYTTALVRDGYCVADWTMHVERLMRTMRALHSALDDMYAEFYSWLESSGTEETEALTRLILPTVLACLQALERSCQREEGGEAMLVIALPPAPAAARLSSGPAAEGCSPASPVCVHAFAMPYKRAAALEGVTVAVVPGAPRCIPEAKDSTWVKDRSPLEQLKPPGAAEAVLCTADGQLLEGLVTNLFVVQDAADGGGTEVLTAPARGVVWGTMRQRVLEACRALGVRVRECSPDAAELATWKEAFLTNSMRVIQPVVHFLWDTAPPGLAHGQRDSALQPGPLTATLREHVLLAMQWSDLHQL